VSIPPAAKLGRLPATDPVITVPEPARRSLFKSPPAIVGGLLTALAVAGGIYVVSRRAPDSAGVRRPDDAPTPAPTRTLLPELQPTPTGPTNGMTATQFRDEVTRRVALETQRLEAEMRARNAPTPIRLGGGPVTRPTTALASLIIAPPPAPQPTPTSPPAIAAVAMVAAPVVVSPAPERPTPVPLPSPVDEPPVALREGALVPLEEVDTPPKIATVVKPTYPPLALKARIGGIVVLRVLVSEKGLPLDVQVARKAPAGLDDAAVAAVRRWTFTPPLEGGVPVRTWMTVPIPFEP